MSASFTPNGQPAMSPSGRAKFAEAALAYWKSFDSRIPRNSPTDQAWLEGELGASQERISAALRSKQYAFWRLVSISENCVSIFAALPDLIGVNPRVELYYWLKATSCYQDGDWTAEYLRVGGLSNGRMDGDFKMQFFSSAMSAINGVIANGAVTEGQ